MSLREGRVRLDRLYQEGCGKAMLPPRRRRAGGGLRQHLGRGDRRGPDRVAARGRAGGGAGRDEPGGGAGLSLARAAWRGSRRRWRRARARGSSGCRRRRSSSTAGGWSGGSRSRWRRTRGCSRSNAWCSGGRPWARRCASGLLSDQWRIRRGGRLVHAEALRMEAFGARGDGDAARRRGRSRRWSRWRRGRRRGSRRRGGCSTPRGVLAAASAKPGVLIVRWLGGDARALRAGAHPLSDARSGTPPCPASGAL